MKIIVRAGIALVIVEENLYTRDLFLAYKIFAKHYPEKELEMKKALLYAIEPITNVEELLYFLNEFGEWIIKESDKWLQIHNPSNANNVI
ncbi:hypothetical protein [Bacillus sp. 7884-1]|uniref:hypothetical protein n=1 Tax=Bacillus sp. 7884-1 TaxID=2021693 RepID=UPI000BA5848B|nr:hypothetical protein [Bacillus sp. 7884-1]PAE39072.1 hypothetical protein CHI06_17235 [Bacillus sp. 7884-1]